MEPTTKHKVSLIIAAAGRGERAGYSKNKLLIPIFGEPALWHTLKKFDIPQIKERIIAASEDDIDEISAIAAPFRCKVVEGGKTRTESVKNALAKVTGDIVLIHDGARPYLSQSLILRCIEDVKKYKSSVCAFPATDTSVTVRREKIFSYIDREGLYLLQTPQGFFTENLRRAYALTGDKSYPDDSSVYAEFIAPPHITVGERANIKLTYADDFCSELPPVACGEANKIGFGVDVHAFCEGYGIVLGGVRINCPYSLLAHSDGDVLFHALTDAILSAAGLKDMGYYFPDDDPDFENADSGFMCYVALQAAKNEGYAPINISLSVQAEKPRLAKYADEIVTNVARVLEIDRKSVAFSAGTCEHLGFVGEGRGITAYACVLLQKINR